MNTKSNTAELILTALQNGSVSVAQIAEAVGKSQSVVRENLVKLVQAETVLMDATKKPSLFSLAKEPVSEGTVEPIAKARAKRAAKAKQPKAEKKADPDAGRGNLNADGKRALLNPQPILNKKMAIAEANGGKFFFNRTGRVWTLVTTSGELSLSAKEVAALSYDEFTQVCQSGELPEVEGEDEADAA